MAVTRFVRRLIERLWHPSRPQRSRYRASKSIESLEPRILLFHNVLNFGDDIHEQITAEALWFLKDDVVGEINNEHPKTDTVFGGLSNPNHFIGAQFLESASRINERYGAALVNANPEAFDDDLEEDFGQILHAVQDFYAHSNWVNLGFTTLVDSGTGYWEAMTPYSFRNGAMFVQGEDETPTIPGLGTAKLKRVAGVGDNVTKDFPGFGIVVDFGRGVKFPGITSATFGPGDDSPDNVEISHGDLNKDFAGQHLFAEARALAVRQTLHEFVRLGTLIREEYGAGGLCRLFDEWVSEDEDAQAFAARLLGVQLLDVAFVIDTTGSMSDDIAAVKASATQIINSLVEDSPCFRVSIVLYRDVGDVYVTKTALAFTEDAQAAIAAIQSISVGGGGDTPEAVLAALDHAILNLDGMGEWRGEHVEKTIILMGDAPPHVPDKSTGATYESVAQNALRAGIVLPLAATSHVTAASTTSDAVDIHTIVIGSSSSAISSFQTIAASNRGQNFHATNATQVVQALLDVLDTVINTAPGLSLPDNSPAAYRKGDSPVPVLGQIQVVDPDFASLKNGSLVISMAFVQNRRGIRFDRLQLPELTIGTDEGELVVDGRNVRIIRLADTTSHTDVQAFLRGITFSTTGKGLKSPARFLEVTVMDAGGLSDTLTQLIEISRTRGGRSTIRKASRHS